MSKINNLKYITAISVVVMLALAALTVACFAFAGCELKDNTMERGEHTYSVALHPNGIGPPNKELTKSSEI